MALTFDAEHGDRPHAGDRSEEIADLLTARRTRATFFLQGRWVEAHPARARRLADDGHLIGSHSHYHARLPLFSVEGLRNDLTDAERAIRTATGKDPRPWFRAPFGNGADQPAILEALAGMGYRHVGWHVAGEEWQPQATADGVGRAVIDGAVAHGDGAIILLHTWPDPVMGALPAILEQIGASGGGFVGVDELNLPPGLAAVGDPHPPGAN